MNNKNLIIIILIVFLLIIGIIGAYFMMNNNNQNSQQNDVIKNNTQKNTTTINNTTTNESLNSNNTNNNTNNNINPKSIDKYKNKPKPQQTNEQILISKKEAIEITKSMLESYEDESSVSNHAKLITIGKKHYWVTKIGGYNQYIDAKTGETVNPKLIGIKDDFPSKYTIVDKNGNPNGTFYVYA